MPDFNKPVQTGNNSLFVKNAAKGTPKASRLMRAVNGMFEDTGNFTALEILKNEAKSFDCVQSVLSDRDKDRDMDEVDTDEDSYAYMRSGPFSGEFQRGLLG